MVAGLDADRKRCGAVTAGATFFIKPTQIGYYSNAKRAEATSPGTVRSQLPRAR
jgi:hypothetical protein